MIAWVFLSAGIAGTVAFAYYTAPAGRGLHRYIVPRGHLRADNRRLEAENDDLACAVIRVIGERDEACKARDEFSDALVAARQQIVGLEEQLTAFDQLCQENTELRAQLSNATAYRPLAPADDTVSALPDDQQEYADTTATAWRARA